MRIDHLSAKPDRAGKYRLQLSDGTVLKLYRQTVEDFGIYSGMALTPEEMESLKTAAEEMSAKMRAVRILSAASVSKNDLKRRLIQKGEDPKQASAAVQWLEDLSLLDDRKTAEQVVSRCIVKGYGLARAKQALFEKRIPKEIWSEVLTDYPDQQDSIVEFLKARLPECPTDKDIRRAVDALQRRGHNYAQIKRAMSQLSLDTQELPEG